MTDLCSWLDACMRDLDEGGGSLNTEELENLLAGAVETPNFDVKAAMAWNCPKLAKHIMAMSNVRDGGTIIVGVDDKIFNRTGVTDGERDTYKEEEMRDQMATFADPGVDFHVSFPVGLDNKTYVAIEIASFRDVPTICKRESGSYTRRGAIYYRSSTGRPSSAEVANSYDMRDILNLAASRTLARNEYFGFVPNPPPSDPLRDSLDDELGDL